MANFARPFEKLYCRRAAKLRLIWSFFLEWSVKHLKSQFWLKSHYKIEFTSFKLLNENLKFVSMCRPSTHAMTNIRTHRNVTADVKQRRPLAIPQWGKSIFKVTLTFFARKNISLAYSDRNSNSLWHKIWKQTLKTFKPHCAYQHPC